PITWNGYGNSRNKGAGMAQHPFVLNIDADEVITAQLAEAINRLTPKAATIYGFKRLNHLGQKQIRHGEWGNDTVWRLYNKNETRWNLAEVHEALEAGGLDKVLLRGALQHFTAADIGSYNKKMEIYARLSARKFLEQRKKAGMLKAIVSPVFSFVQNYVFRLGVLDGREGWDIARAHYLYNRNRYLYLQRLKREHGQKKQFDLHANLFNTPDTLCRSPYAVTSPCYCVCLQACTTKQPEAENPPPLAKPSPQQYAWQEQERIMFIHFGMATWQGREYDNFSTDLSRVNPYKINTDDWCKTAQSLVPNRSFS
ncbi:MAG: hypothetical protein QM664_09545, partial [Flavihumibacter sp.]